MSGFAGLLLGSDSQRVATHVLGPVVVVVRGRSDPAEGPVDHDADERARLEEQLAPWRGQYPATRVEAVLTRVALLASCDTSCS